MTNFPAASYWSNSARTELEAKTWGEDVLAATKQLLGGAPRATYTIASDTITPVVSNFVVDTQAAASTDDLRNILTTNLPDGSLILLKPATAGHTVVVKHAAGGSGQVTLGGAADFSMSTVSMGLLLERRGADWYEVQRIFGAGDGVAQRNFYGGAAGLGQNRYTGRQEFNQGANVASAATLAIGTDGNTFAVTGSATIAGISAAPVGTWIRLFFVSPLRLVYSANLALLGGVDHWVYPGEWVEFCSVGVGIWYEVNRAIRSPHILYNSAVGNAVNAAQLETAIFSATVPALMGYHGRLRFHANGRIIWAQNPAYWVQFKVFFGPGLLVAALRANDQSTAANGYDGFILDATISNYGSLGQQIVVASLQNGNSMLGTQPTASRATMDMSTPTVDTTVDQLLQVNILWSAFPATTTLVSFDNATLELMV